MTPVKPLSAVSPLSFVAPAKSVQSAGPVQEALPPQPSDQAFLSGTLPPAPPPPPEPTPAAPEPAPKASSEPVPVTLAMHDEAGGQEELRWILDAASDTVVKDHPALEDVRRRFPQLPEEIRAHGTIPLLDALTTPGAEAAGARLESFHDTMTWARKHRAEAREMLAGGGDWKTLEQAALAASQEVEPQSSLDRVLASPSLLKSYPLGHNHQAEASRLIDQFEAGNSNPGLGTKSLGKGICYLRGREGTRIFYRMQDDKPQWLAVCNKSNEQSAINLLYREFDLK